MNLWKDNSKVASVFYPVNLTVGIPFKRAFYYKYQCKCSGIVRYPNMSYACHNEKIKQPKNYREYKKKYINMY